MFICSFILFLIRFYRKKKPHSNYWKVWRKKSKILKISRWARSNGRNDLSATFSLCPLGYTLSVQLYFISYFFRQHGANACCTQRHYSSFLYCECAPRARTLCPVQCATCVCDKATEYKTKFTLLFSYRIVFLKRLVAWFFERKINYNSAKLKKLRSEKKLIIEKVMDKETYKVALEILNRFSENSPKPGQEPYPSGESSMSI